MLRRWMLIAAALPLVALVGLVTVQSVERVGQPFPGFLVWNNGYLVSFHTASWTGAQSGIPLNGGRVTEVDGARFDGGRALLDHVTALPPGTVVEYRVQYRGEQTSYEVPTMILSGLDFLETFGNYLLNALACFAIALVAVGLRPDHPQSQALALVMVLLGLTLVLAIDLNTTYRMIPLYLLCEAAAPAATVALALVFPVPRFERRRRWLLNSVLFSFALCMGIANVHFYYNDPEFARALTSAAYVEFGLAGIALIFVCGHGLLRGNTAQQRVQSAVVFAGALVSFLLPSAGLLAFFLLGWTFSLTWATALIFFFPLSVLYAIVRHDLFEAERFIRITMGYTVASAAVALVYAGGLTGLERVFTPGAATGPATTFVLLLVVAIAFDPIRQQVQRTVDRVFYKTLVDSGQLLEEAATRLASLRSEPEIRDAVENFLAVGLAPEWIVHAPEIRIGSSLAEPLRYLDEELGWLSLGPKRSGAPYSISEREMLRGLATTATLAIRNVRSMNELRKAQESLIRAERLAVIGEFAGAVAHGIRNPLAGIRAAAQVAQGRTDDAVASASLDGVISEADRLEARIRRLLDYSQRIDPRPMRIDANSLLTSVAEALDSQAARNGVRIEVEHTSADLVVETDAGRMEETLLELGNNALRAMPDGGSVRFSAEQVGERCIFRVADTARGINEAVRGRIFEPFFTTRREGTGMGLAMIKKIVEALGGELALETSGASGSVFRVSLPIISEG